MGIFTNVLRRLLATDKAHADLFNEINDVLIENDLYLKDRVDKTDHSFELQLTAAGWKGTSAPYTQDVPVAGITSSDVPIGCPKVPSGASVDVKKSAGYIDGFTTEDGRITFYCNRKKPTVDITVTIKGV